MSPQQQFEAERSFLTQLAYRMLGSVQDAEDVVQETFLRWHRQDIEKLAKPRAWLTRVATNLCLDRLRSSHQGPQYPGEWLPEPWITPEQERQDLDDTLSLALLSAIRRLSATERAVFLLHDVFDYEFADIASILDLQPANCRQLASRARRHLSDSPPRQRDRELEQRLGLAFFRALREGEVEGLQKVLREDVVMRSDGGGKVAAVHYPLHGREAVVRFFDRLFMRTKMLDGCTVHSCWFNAAPGFAVRHNGQIEAAYQFDLCEGLIQAVHIQRNPDKLTALEQLLTANG